MKSTMELQSVQNFQDKNRAVWWGDFRAKSGITTRRTEVLFREK
jgi:hypothetical protein